MARIDLNIPDHLLNQLNNFYIDNFGYEIKTQFYNFLFAELEKCKESSTEKPVPQPVPTISYDRKNYSLIVKYPDGSRSMIKCGSYEECIDLLNEWSKYSYSKDKKDKVYFKFGRKIQNVTKTSTGRWKVSKNPNNKGEKRFGTYDTFDDAHTVKKFLEKHNWDLKYQPKIIAIYNDELNQYTASDYLLELAKKELEQ